MSTTREVAEQIIKDCPRLSAGPYDTSRELYLPALTDSIDRALQSEREQCARRAMSARLPRGYEWGHDAMEQFNFGKERAAKAIREGKPQKCARKN